MAQKLLTPREISSFRFRVGQKATKLYNLNQIKKACENLQKLTNLVFGIISILIIGIFAIATTILIQTPTQTAEPKVSRTLEIKTIYKK